ncbi:MAG: DUF4835 family protein [Solitalea-like symbiont of Acarus siro]
MRPIIISILLLLITIKLKSQDLNITVKVNAPGIYIGNRQILTSLTNDVQTFLNNTNFVNLRVKSEERIEGNLILTIRGFDKEKTFTVTAQIQSWRPVYNTNYNSIVLNFQDKEWTFDYFEGKGINYSESGGNDELSLLLTYYAYMIIGFDTDTFSDRGGTQYFNRALIVVNEAQNLNQRGWKALDSKHNRYWLVENLLNPNLRALRDFTYIYHREGLDVFMENPRKAREIILSNLPKLKKMIDNRPNSYFADLFFHC